MESLEAHHRKVRRSWTPERRAADRARRVKARRVARYDLYPLKADESHAYALEEANIVRYLNSCPGAVKLWVLLNEMAGEGQEAVKRPRRQRYLAVTTRMIKEGKLIRYRKWNKVGLALWLNGNVQLDNPENAFIPEGAPILTRQPGWDGFLVL